MSTPLAFEWAFFTGVNELFKAWLSTHNILLGGSPGALLFGMIAIGLAHRDTLLTITPAFSRIFSSHFTHFACFKGKLYGFDI